MNARQRFDTRATRVQLQELGEVDHRAAGSWGLFLVLSRPFFKVGRDTSELSKPESEMTWGISNEDLFFSNKARLRGFDLWANGDYTCSHFRTVNLGGRATKKFRNQ